VAPVCRVPTTQFSLSGCQTESLSMLGTVPNTCREGTFPVKSRNNGASSDITRKPSRVTFATRRVRDGGCARAEGRSCATDPESRASSE
jgi:hypothetical protein